MKNITNAFLMFALVAIITPSLTYAMTTGDVEQQFKLFKYGDPASPKVLGASATASSTSVPASKVNLTDDERRVVIKALRYTAGSSTIINKTLKLGATNEEVKKLQLFLASQGYLNADPTGKYGAKTKEAVIKFQKAKGLKADGSVGPVTIKSITSDVESLTTDIKQ